MALHCSAIPVAVEQLGAGLLGLKRLAQLAAEELIGQQSKGVELIGYFNDDQMIETRPYLTLIYRARYLPKHGDQIAAPDNYSWVNMGQAKQLPLEPISSMVLAGI